MPSIKYGAFKLENSERFKRPHDQGLRKFETECSKSLRAPHPARKIATPINNQRRLK